MPINNSFQFQAPSMQQPLANIFNSPIVARRAPTTADLNYPIGQVWVQPKTAAGVAVNGYWALTSVVNNAAIWTDLVTGAGVFSSLTVTPGPTSLTGQFTVIAGTNAVSIGADAADHTTTIGSTSGSSALALRGGSGASSITTAGGTFGISTGAGNISIGADATAKSITIGNITGATAVVVNAGSGASSWTTTGGALTLNTGVGTLGLSTDAAATTLNIGTGAAVKTTNVGSTNGASITTVAAGTGGLNFSAGGNVAMATVISGAASPTATVNINARVGRATFTGFTTANAGGSQAFTISNTGILTTSGMLVTVTHLNASGNGAFLQIQNITQAASSIVVTVVNNGAGALGAGDDVIISFWQFS